MELTNDFLIDRPVEETWVVLNNLEFIAPCMPGAQLTEIEGDEYRGTVKIKVGPISAQYKGKASFVEQDAVNHKAQLKAEGRDPRQGNANAMVFATMEPSGDDATKVTIRTDLKLSGKVASFGRGIIEDVSKNILGQFVENLRLKLEAEGTPVDVEVPSAEAAATSGSADGNGAAPSTESAAPADEAPKVRKIDAPEAEAVDLLAVTGSPITKRLAPVLGAVVLLLVLRWLLGGRGD
jgi:carbon monoxide dehydrogenase subunit G